MFDSVARDIIDGSVNGFNGTIFAYGQTSSGKTHTMSGDDNHPGIIGLSAARMFDSISNSKRKFNVSVAYLELYMENLIDLLLPESTNISKDKQPRIVTLADGNQDIQNVEERPVNSLKDVLSCLQEGQLRRHVAETAMNDRSSRSHTILRFRITSKSIIDDIEPGADRDINGDNVLNMDSSIVQMAFLNLVDLAGSEGVSKTQAEGNTRSEGGSINKSLLALSKMIAEVSENAQKGNNKSKDVFIASRDSKLTYLLKNSIGGNARTSIICATSPANVNYHETKSTLEFAKRAAAIRNTLKRNIVVDKDPRIALLKKKVSALQEELRISKEREAYLRSRMTAGEAAEAVENDFTVGIPHAPSIPVDLGGRTLTRCQTGATNFTISTMGMILRQDSSFISPDRVIEPLQISSSRANSPVVSPLRAPPYEAPVQSSPSFIPRLQSANVSPIFKVELREIAVSPIVFSNDIEEAIEKSDIKLVSTHDVEVIAAIPCAECESVEQRLIQHETDFSNKLDIALKDACGAIFRAEHAELEVEHLRKQIANTSNLNSEETFMTILKQETQVKTQEATPLPLMHSVGNSPIKYSSPESPTAVTTIPITFQDASNSPLSLDMIDAEMETLHPQTDDIAISPIKLNNFQEIGVGTPQPILKGTAVSPIKFYLPDAAVGTPLAIQDASENACVATCDFAASPIQLISLKESASSPLRTLLMDACEGTPKGQPSSVLTCCQDLILQVNQETEIDAISTHDVEVIAAIPCAECESLEQRLIQHESNLAKKLDVASDEITQAELSAEAAISRAASAEAAIITLREDLSRSNNAKEVLEGQLAGETLLTNQIAKLKQEVEGLTRSLAIAVDTKIIAEDEMQNAKERQEVAEMASKNMQTQVLNLQAEVSQLQSEVESKMDIESATADKIETSQMQIKGLLCQLEMEQRDAQLQQTQIVEMQAELDSASVFVLELQATITSLIERHASELEIADLRNDSLFKEYHTIQEESLVKQCELQNKIMQLESDLEYHMHISNINQVAASHYEELLQNSSKTATFNSELLKSDPNISAILDLLRSIDADKKDSDLQITMFDSQTSMQDDKAFQLSISMTNVALEAASAFENALSALESQVVTLESDLEEERQKYEELSSTLEDVCGIDTLQSNLKTKNNQSMSGIDVNRVMVDAETQDGGTSLLVDASMSTKASFGVNIALDEYSDLNPNSAAFHTFVSTSILSAPDLAPLRISQTESSLQTDETVASISGLEDKIARFQRTLENTRTQAMNEQTHAAQQLEAAVAQMNEISTRLDASCARTLELESLLEESQERLLIQQQDRVSLESSVDRLKIELQKAKSLASESVQNLSDVSHGRQLESEVLCLRVELDNRNASIESLENDLSEARKHTARLYELRESLERKASTLETQAKLHERTMKEKDDALEIVNNLERKLDIVKNQLDLWSAGRSTDSIVLTSAKLLSLVSNSSSSGAGMVANSSISSSGAQTPISSTKINNNITVNNNNNNNNTNCKDLSFQQGQVASNSNAVFDLTPARPPLSMTSTSAPYLSAAPSSANAPATITNAASSSSFTSASGLGLNGIELQHQSMVSNNQSQRSNTMWDAMMPKGSLTPLPEGEEEDEDEDEEHNNTRPLKLNVNNDANKSKLNAIADITTAESQETSSSVNSSAVEIRPKNALHDDDSSSDLAAQVIRPVIIRSSIRRVPLQASSAANSNGNLSIRPPPATLPSLKGVMKAPLGVDLHGDEDHNRKENTLSTSQLTAEAKTNLATGQTSNTTRDADSENVAKDLEGLKDGCNQQ